MLIVVHFHTNLQMYEPCSPANLVQAAVLECEDYTSDAELEGAMSECSIFIIFVSDEHMRSKVLLRRLIPASVW